MKIAVVYNRESQNVINLFGIPNREKYGLQTIRRITDALKKGKHQITAVEGDKDLIHRLEEFMPRVLKGENPGMVFNLSYGIQGQARYTHVPSILEMVGIPYVGSGPLAHSLALDKVVAKMIFRQHGLPTPDFVVLEHPEFDPPDLEYPLIVKPKNESTSFGLAVVHDEEALKEASAKIFEEFGEQVLVERYIEGREINVGLLGNNLPEVLPPVELHFGDDGPQVYTMEDKKGTSGREVEQSCPADLDPELTAQAQDLAVRAFGALGCVDCARVDFRVDRDGRLYILEVNSLPSLGPNGSFPLAAKAIGLEYPTLINRLVEVASARYFGTPNPPRLNGKGTDSHEVIFGFLTARRDQMERRLREWISISSRTEDLIGMRSAFKEADTRLKDIGLRRASNGGEEQVVGLWESSAGLDGGTLLVCQVDVPLGMEVTGVAFRREPERIYGEGVGVSRAPLVMMEFALRALKASRKLGRTPIGVLCYGDEGLDCRFSARVIRSVARRVRRVLVLRPGTAEGKIYVGRRGLKKYHLVAEGQPKRLGQLGGGKETLPWVFSKISQLIGLSDRKARISISASDVRTSAHPTLLPHRVSLSLLVGYPQQDGLPAIEQQIRETLGRRGLPWELEAVANRPPMVKRTSNATLAQQLINIAERWEIPLGVDTSVVPSVAGLVPEGTAVVCGLSPAVSETYTPRESVQRLSLMQRSLILAQYLVDRGGRDA